MASKSAPPWRNRIVGQGEEAPDQLLANPLNFRLHPKRQQDALSGALKELGWIQQVIVNRITGHVIDGHLRVELAISRGEPTVPVVYVELSPDEEKLALATFDPISAMAGVDREKLDDLLSDVRPSDSMLQEMLDGLASKPALSGAHDEGLELWGVVVECEDEAEQVAVLRKLTADGHRVRALIP